jgi:diguanylate cyclase (GGDEF)-like protein/PAS domain S-box-containing protein
VTEQRGSLATEHWFRFAQSAVPQLCCDLQGCVIEVNDAFSRLVGRPRRDVVGRPFADLDHATDPGTAAAELHELALEQTEVSSVERLLCGPDDRPLAVLVVANLVRDDAGRPLGTAVFLQDLTRLRDAEQRSQQQEDFFAALALRASDLAIVADAEGRLLFISAAARSVLGYTAADELMRLGWDFVHPEDLPLVRSAYEGLVRDGGTRTVLLRVRSADGAWRHIEETMANMLDTPVGGVVCNLRDVTEHVEAQRALAASEARYRSIAENAHEGIWVSAQDGSTSFVNQRMLDITGLSTEEVYGDSPFERLGGVQARQMADRLGTRSTVGAERYEIDYPHPDGGIRHLLISATPLRDDTGFEGSLALVSDITSSRTATRLLQHAAAHDTLTDLPNRAHLLAHALSALERSPDSTALLFVDLDDFKVVNDARGHDAGDQLLREVADRLRSAVRPGDLVARFGGDEFVVVCEHVTPAAARAVGERLLRAIEEPSTDGGGLLHGTASIGIAMSPAASVEQLLHQADTAMYAAKAAGRRAIRFFDDGLAGPTEDQDRSGRDLGTALGDDQLQLAYRPVVDLRSGAVLGVEGLVRWRAPGAGSGPTHVRVPAAHGPGLAGEADLRALHQAAGDLVAFRAGGLVAVHTYVTGAVDARTLDDPALLAELEQVRTQHGLRPRDLAVQVSEATVALRGREGTTVLRALTGAGHRVTIAGFGAGQSAFSCLGDVPCVTLRLDRSFVRDLATSRAARAIVGSVIGLAHGLQMEVVADGVQDAVQVDALRELGCDGGQGPLWSPARSRADIEGDGAFCRTD